MLSYNSIIYNTLKQVFPNIIVSPGEDLWLFASDSPNWLSDDINMLSPRLTVPTKYITESFIMDRFQPERLKYIKEMLKQVQHDNTYSNTPLLNSDFHPIGYYYNNIITGSYFSGTFRKVFIKLLSIPFWLMLITVVVIVSGIGYFVNPKAFGIGILGGSGMGLQLFLILAFEVLYGYVYHKIGIITAAFMLGVVLGAKIGELKDIKLNTVIGAMSLYLLLMLAIMKLVVINEFLFYLFPVINGTFIGIAWTNANKSLINNGESVERASGLLNGADLLGSCIGLFLLSVIFIPVYGLYKAMLLLII